MTIYLSGAINLVSQDELQREAGIYAQNGWEYKDPTTHKVSVQIAQRDIEAFCDYLRNKPVDRRPRVWRDRDGNEHQEPTVTFFLNGSEMTGTWIRLRSSLKTTPQGLGEAAAASTPTPAPVRRTPAPVRRAPATASTPAPAAVPAPQHPPATPDRPPVWTSAPLDPEDDDEIPF